MPDDEFEDTPHVLADGLGPEVEHEQQEIFDGGGLGAGPGSGDGAGPVAVGDGGSAAATGDGPPVFIVDTATGEVSTGHFDPETGAVEVDQPETIVIEQTSSPSSVGGGTSAEGGRQSGADSPGSGPEPDQVPFMINPDSFKFRRVQENWQETRCTEIRFAYGSAFMAPMVIRVGVVVGAPITLSNGRQLTSREAQLDSANAAQAAATLIIALLDEGAIIPSEIQPRFTGLMGGAMLANGLGYRVTGCFPG